MNPCHFEYKGLKYDSLSQLYPIIAGEKETAESPVSVAEKQTTVKSPARRGGRVASVVTDIKTEDELNNLTRYKLNKFTKEVLLKNLFTDVDSIVMDYLVRGNKINKESIASELYGKEAYSIPNQMKSLRWVSEIGGKNTIQDIANRIVNDSDSNFGVSLDVNDVRNSIIDIINSYGSLNDVKTSYIEKYLKTENPIWGKDNEVENEMSFMDFARANSVTDGDRELAMASIAGGDFISGKRLITPDGVIIVSNANPERSELFTYYNEGDENVELHNVLAEQLIDIYAHNMKYESYLSGTMDAFNTADIVDDVEFTVNIPSTEEALRFPEREQTSTPFLSATEEQNFKSYGYNPSDSSLTNINNSLTHIVETTTDPVVKLLAKKYLANIDTFNGIEIILDNEMSTAGVATSRANESTGIRLNPSRIGNANQYARVLIEEMTHALTRKEARNLESPITQRLMDLYTQARGAYGNDLLASQIQDQQEARELRAKERAGIPLTQEETDRLNVLVGNGIEADGALIYALSNFDEFIAHIGINRSLQRHLNNIKETDTQKSLYSKFVDIIIQLLEALGMKIDNKGVFKYALHDMFDIVDKSIKNSNIGRALSAKSTRSKAFVYNKLGLKTDNNADVPVTNGKIVTDFINSTYSNLVALQDTDSNVIKLYYRDELSKEQLKQITQDIKGDASYSFDFPLFDDSGSSEMFDYNSPFDDGGDVFNMDFGSYSEAATNFDLQLKVYLTNLNDRERSLQRSKEAALDSIPTNREERRIQALKVNEIEKQIEATKQVIKRITDKRSTVLPFNNIIDVAYTGMSELEAIDETLKRPLSSSDIVYMLQTIKFWQDAKKSIFIQENYKDSAVDNLYSTVERLAEDKLKTVLPILDQFVIDKVVKKHTKFNGTVEDLAKEFTDLSRLEGLVNNLGVVDSALLQAIGKEIKNQNEIRGEELYDQVKRFEEVAKAAQKALKAISTNKDDPHDIFRQRDSFGRKTKDIVTRLSYAYQQARKGALGFVYNSNSEKSNDQAEKALDFLHSNTEQVKYSVLFPLNDSEFNQDAYNAEASRLKELMGSNHYAEWYGRQAKNIEDFKKYRDFKISDLMERFELSSVEEVMNHPEAGRYYNHYMETNSLYGLESKLENYNKGKKHFTLAKNYNVFKYLVDIPKKTFSANGKETVSYDPAYQTIERTPEVYAYYQGIINSLDSIGKVIPFESGDKISKNGIPEFKAQMYELFMEEGMKSGMDAFATYMYDIIRTERASKGEVKVDIITGKEKQRIPTGLWSSNSLINQELQLKSLAFTNENGVAPSQDQIEDWRSEITEKYANSMQGDLSKVIPMYIALGLAYKHKAKIEDGLIIAREMFNQLPEYERDRQGNLIADTSDLSGKSFLHKRPEESFKRAKEIIEGTYNSVLYGNTRDVRSGKKKILSPAEKRHKKVLEDHIAELKEAYNRKVYNTSEYLTFRDMLQKQIDGLGAYSDKEKTWDLPLRYTQWRGMGWNVIGGISNALFGYTSNLIEAAGQEFYTQNDLAKAYSKVFRHSFVRNATFNRGGGEEAVKIRSLMDRFTILSDSGSEYKSLVGSDLTERLKWLSAFNMNERTEYINQAPLMLVTFEKATFEHNREMHKLYDGFNTDGSWNTEEFGEYPAEIARKAVLKTKALVERNHGNYNPMSPILAKRSGLGRLLLQFRTWMVEGVRTRLGDKEGRYDEILDAEIKGRYISAIDVFKNDWKGASLGLGLQIIRNFIPFGNKWMANFTPIDKYIQGNENVRAVDIANMKRLAMELNIFIGSLVVMLAAKALAEGLDDDDPKKWGINLLINQGTRLRTDVLMYVNPLEAKKLIQDPIPSMKILTDVAKFKDAVDKTIIQGSPEYESGIYQGHNRIFRNTVNLIPGLSQGYRISSQTFQTFDDK